MHIDDWFDHLPEEKQQRIGYSIIALAASVLAGCVVLVIYAVFSLAN